MFVTFTVMFIFYICLIASAVWTAVVKGQNYDRIIIDCKYNHDIMQFNVIII